MGGDTSGHGGLAGEDSGLVVVARPARSSASDGGLDRRWGCRAIAYVGAVVLAPVASATRDGVIATTWQSSRVTVQRAYVTRESRLTSAGA